jgi:hypothetical protein
LSFKKTESGRRKRLQLLGFFAFAPLPHLIAMRVPASSEAVVLAMLVVLVSAVLFAALLEGPIPSWAEMVNGEEPEGRKFV